MILKLRNLLHNDIGLRELLSGGAVSFFMQCSGMLSGYMLMALIANYFGARILGVYSFSYAALTVGIILSSAGLDMVVLKVVGKSESISSISVLKKIYSVVIPWALIFTCGIIIAAFLYSKTVFDEPEYKKYLVIAGCSILFSVILAINIEYLRAEGKIAVSEFLRSVIRPATSFFLIIIICFYYYNVYIPAYTMLISVFLACACSIYFIFGKTRKTNIHKPEIKETIKSLLQSGLPMQASTMLFYLISNMVIFFVKGYENSTMVGLILVSMKLAGLINMPLMVLNKVCAPRFSRLYSASLYDELQKYLSQVTKLAFYIAVAVAVFLMVFSNTMLLVFGNDFLQAKKLMCILVFGQVVSCASGSVGVFMMMTGNEKAYQNIAALVASLSLLAYCLILPKYGIVGAACVLACSQASLNIASAIYIKYRLGFVTMYIPFLQRVSFSKL